MSYVRYYDAPNGLWRFFVRHNEAGQPVTVNDALAFRQHDWPWADTGPLGQETCDSVLSADGFAGFEYESFPPWQPPYTAQGGNGGDVSIVTSDGWAKLPATMDGGHPAELYYFVGPGLGQPGDGRVGGWVAAGPNVQVGSWQSTVCYIEQSPNTPYQGIGSPSPAFTRYLIDTFAVPFMTRGVEQPAPIIETLVSEHYSTADPTTADAMERFFYCASWGKVRWEIWNNAPSGPGLSERAPPIKYGYPNYPSMNPSLVMTDVRTYTNIVPQPAALITPNLYLPGSRRRIADFGWPPNFVLP